MKCPKCGRRQGIAPWWYPLGMMCYCHLHKSLSQLSKAEEIKDEDLLLITQEGQSKSITISQLKNYLKI